ncbi:MAG: gamma-glutamyl-gamma-aminobutyrate hydrolase family protein [Chitinivibrionia bacterium]|nr:gamma-glutamyl-gamma-aminobutyrate hydrolase family protein [Chitinivibrionia bacterium]
MRRTIIGVLPLWDEKKDSVWMLPGYMQGLEEAGGAPIILPLTASEETLKNTAEICDGFLFTGGHDVNPERYGQKKRECCEEICDLRDKMEEHIFREEVLNKKKSALGICRGIQIFNVLLGGSLYQDIPAEFSKSINHAQKPPFDVFAHSVKIFLESPLGKIIKKERIEVNSSHHQGINEISKELEIMALADDGLIEAAYMPTHPYLWAVQWHPELLLKDEISKKIFTSFVNSTKKLTKNRACAVETALCYFKDGFSCSEAVLRAFNETYELGLCENDKKIASAFGAGMGESGCACGAITACTMAFGLIAGRKNVAESNKLSLLAAKELQNKFKELHKSVCCRALTKNVEWKSAERKKLCENYVKDAVKIADDIIKNNFSQFLT